MFAEEMLQVKSFGEIIDLSNSLQESCTDQKVTRADGVTNFIYDPYEDLVKYVEDGDSIHSGKFTPYSFSQLCTRLGIPIRYMEKCKEVGHSELIAYNINEWLRMKNKNLLVRKYKEDIRGIVSQKYSVLDTPDILEVLQPHMLMTNAKVVGYYLSPERFHMRAILAQMSSDEDIFAGFQVDSSDVGRSTLSVTFFVWKQVCSNGLMIAQDEGQLFKQRHINISKEDFVDGLQRGMEIIPEVLPLVAKQINYAKSKAMPYEFVTEKGVQDFIEDMKNHIQLSESDSHKVIELMKSKYGDTRWSLINSLTELAQEYTLEKRLDVERYAGNLLLVA